MMIEGKRPGVATADLETRFNYHPPGDRKKPAHERVRQACLDLAKEFGRLVPPGREHAVALTHLEEVMFWANAGIARKTEEDYAATMDAVLSEG